MPGTTAAEGGLSRRALFGLGLAQALEAASPALAARPPSAPRGAVVLAAARETDARGLGPRLAPLARVILDRVAVPEGRRLLVVAAGDGTPLVEEAAARGHQVVAVESDPELLERGRGRLPVADWRAGPASACPVSDAGFGAVVAWFGASYDPDPRRVAGELLRAAAPGAPLVLSAWTPESVRRLGLPRPSRGHRPEAWSRYETAYRHFFDLPDLDVVEADADGLPAALVLARRPA